MKKLDYVFIISLSRLKHGINQWFPFVSCYSIIDAKRLFEERYGESIVKELNLQPFPDENTRYWSIYTKKGNKQGLITIIPHRKAKND